MQEMAEIQHMSYRGNQIMSFGIGGHDHEILIGHLLKFESTTPVDEIIAADPVLQHGVEMTPEYLAIFNDLRRFMSTCTCEFECGGCQRCSGYRQEFIELTGISMSGHHEWRECFALRIVCDCMHEEYYQIQRVLNGEYYKCQELVGDFFVLAKLGYSHALDTITANVHPSDFTLSQLIIMARRSDKYDDDADELRIKAAIMIYNMQQVGLITKSARE